MRRDLFAVGACAILAAAAVRAQTYDPLQSWQRNHRGVESTATVHDCVACHGDRSVDVHASHPVEVDYATAARRPGTSLRPPEQVVQRGVLLPDGKIHCFTCHDPRSPWKFHIAIPPGAAPHSAVIPGEASTYDRDRSGPVPGDEVSATPLCLCCHAFD